MKRLWAKKGFTLVELIVVIALIALLIAIVIPLLNTGSAYESDARDKAQAFYSNVQEAMTEERVNDKDDGEMDTVKVVCANVKGANTAENSYGSLADVDIYVIDQGAASLPADPIDKEDSSQQWAELANTVEKLLSTTDVSGWFYAVVDTKYRVVCAYFVRSPLATYEKINGNKFSSECHVKFEYDGKQQEAYMGAYPVEYWNGDKIPAQFFQIIS